MAAENRCRTLFDAVPDPVSIIAFDGNEVAGQALLDQTLDLACFKHDSILYDRSL